MKTKFAVEIFNSKKTGKKCAALIADLGYRKAFLNFDINLIAELLNCSVREVYDFDVGIYDLE